jgi:hypothetical protein
LAKVGENCAREVRHLVEVADLDGKFFVDCSGREPHCRRTFRLQPLPFVDVREKRGGSSQTAPNTRSNIVVDLEIEGVDRGMYGTMVACIRVSYVNTIAPLRSFFGAKALCPMGGRGQRRHRATAARAGLHLSAVRARRTADNLKRSRLSRKRRSHSANPYEHPFGNSPKRGHESRVVQYTTEQATPCSLIREPNDRCLDLSAAFYRTGPSDRFISGSRRRAPPYFSSLHTLRCRRGPLLH